MGEDIQKNTLPTLFHFVRIRAAYQTHVYLKYISVLILVQTHHNSMIDYDELNEIIGLNLVTISETIKFLEELKPDDQDIGQPKIIVPEIINLESYSQRDWFRNVFTFALWRKIQLEALWFCFAK